MILMKFIDILSAVLTGDYFTNIFLPLFCIAFIATVPCILRHFFGRD